MGLRESKSLVSGLTAEAWSQRRAVVSYTSSRLFPQFIKEETEAQGWERSSLEARQQAMAGPTQALRCPVHLLFYVAARAITVQLLFLERKTNFI